MNKQEFESRVKKQVSDSDYLKIEKIYTYHPAISATEGKDEIAYIYNHFGMTVINDMYPRAKECEALDKEIVKARAELEKLEEEYNEICGK